MTAALDGVRVLVVEDEFLIAMLLQEMLESAGCVISGPIPRLAEALDAAAGGTYDAAVLDVNLAGERVDPVAHALARRDIPFVFVTGIRRQHIAGRLCPSAEPSQALQNGRPP